MKNLKTNWLSDLTTPGFLLLTGLSSTAISFAFFWSNKFFHYLIVGSVICWLGTLIKIKYQKLKWVFGIIIFLFSMCCFYYINQSHQIDLKQNLVIYPDQVNRRENFVYGQGKIGKEKVSFSLKADNSLDHALKGKKTFRLDNIEAEIEKVAGPTNPGEMDFRKYYQAHNIYRRLKIKNYQVFIKKQTLIDHLHNGRAKIQEYLSNLPRLVSFMANEMILAQNPSKDNRSILNDYRDLGVIHLLSISGLHVGLYTLALGWLCAYLKRTEIETLLICGVCLGLEIFLSDFQPGFVRASLSFLLSYIFKLKKINLSSGDCLGLVLLIHLFICPQLFLSSGAILSYLLVLGLEITPSLSLLKQGIILNFLITPILLHFFYQVNVLTVFYNFLIVPIFNYILLPLTFVGIVCAANFSFITNSIENIFELITSLIQKIAQTKLGLITFGQINWWQTCLLLYLTFLIIIKPQAKLKNIKVVRVLIISYLAIFIGIHFPLTGQISFIDVGQGDSILITTPIFRKAYLIDIGGKLNFGKTKSEPQINRITIPFLKSQGISKLDGVFLSHQDADHIGDLGPLLEEVPVKKLYFASGLTDNASFRKRINGKIAHTKLVPLLAGDQIKEKDICFQVVYPFQKGLGKNEDSLSLWFNLAGKNWLFTGDLDRAGEKKIYQQYNLPVDYFKLGHHGSKTASDPEFMELIHPKLVFISSGRNNRFGHPHPETMQTLNKLQIPSLNTQDNGTIKWTYSNFGYQNFSTFLKGKIK